MDKVEAAHIAYAAVLARFGVSSQSRWSEKDGRFNYCKFYYIAMDLIDECEDVEWKDGLLKHFNILFFKNEEGRGGDLTAMDDDSTPASTSKKGGFLSRMRAQAAARAAHAIKSSPVVTNDIPAETSLASPIIPKVVDALERQLPPQPSLEESMSPGHVSAYAQVLVTITPVDTSALDHFSELSEIEPDEESRKLKSSAAKGKRKVTGRDFEGRPSKRKSGRKKAGNNV